MSCVLRVFGASLDVDAIVREVSLIPYRIDRRGERRLPTSDAPVHKDSGVHYLVCPTDFGPLELQVRDAIVFLTANSGALGRLSVFPGVETAILDFGIEWRDAFVHSDFLPPELLRLAGSVNLGIELSHYQRSPEDSGVPEGGHGS